MIFWSRWGILVLLIAFACFLATEFALEAFSGDQDFYQSHGWAKSIALILAALVVTPLGLTMNKPTYIFGSNGRPVAGGHSFFFIPMEIWGPIFLVLAVVALFY